MCGLFWRCHRVSRMRAWYCPRMRIIGLVSAWLHCLHPPLIMLPASFMSFCPPQRSHPSIHPIERWGRMCGPAAGQSELESFVNFSFFSLLLTSGEHSSGVILGYPEPLTGRTKARTRLCLLLVRLADWLTTIHDHWFAGCAFGRRAPDKFRHRLPDVVQWRLSVHCNWKGKKHNNKSSGKNG